MTDPNIFTFLLGGGAVATATAIFKGATALLSGATARQRQTSDRIEERLRDAEDDRDYYRQVCGDYGYQLREAGVDPDPRDPVPPSRRRLYAYDDWNNRNRNNTRGRQSGSRRPPSGGEESP